MQTALPIVVFGAVAFSVVMSLGFLISRSSLYDEIEQGGFFPDGGSASMPVAPAPESAAGRVEREREIRQLLSARSERLVRKGQPALDIDAEVALLLEPAHAGGHDAGIAEEVRQLVVARNERRVRRGLEALDVEAEVTRTLAELNPAAQE